jgi:hypothetical protein
VALLVNVPLFLPYNKIPRHLPKSTRSYVKGTNIYVIRGGGATRLKHKHAIHDGTSGMPSKP